MYYSTQRPVDIGTFPKTENGPVIIFNFDTWGSVVKEDFKAWGYFVYDAPLTEKQIDDYELRAALDHPDVVKRMREQAQIVGHWEEMKCLPDNERYTWHRPSIHAFEMRSPRVSPEQMAKRFDLAKRDLTRSIAKRPAPKPIAEQLAEAGKQVERGIDTPAKKNNKSHEDR